MNALLCLILACLLVVVGVAPVYAQTAISGSQTMSAQSLSGMGSVTVTAGSTLTIDLGTGSGLTLSGSLTNAGTIYATSQGSSAAFNMNTFTNQSGGTFASLAPGLSLTFNVSNFYNHGMIDSTGHLTVNSANALVNTGTMRAAGDVNLTSAIGNIVNSGTITATTGNININSLVNSLLVNNAGGVLQAYNGSINLGVLDALKTDITASGGDWLSKELNVYTNGGTFDARVGQLSGLLNTYAENVHVGASTTTLTLGPIDAKDPVYYNDAGGIDINGNVSVGESLVIAASGDVTWTGGGGPSSIQARAGGQGFDIYIVAGASISSALVSSVTTVSGAPPAGASPVDVTINGPSGLGGSILFGSGSNLLINSSSTATNANGGNITLVAFANLGGANGIIDLASASPGNTGTILNSSGGVGGANGNVTLIAGGAGQAIHTGTIFNATPGALANTGDVSISAAQPDAGGGVTFNPNGQLASPTFSLSALTSGASVLLGGNIDSGNSISVTASGDIRSEVVQTASITFPSPPVQGSMVGSLLYLPLSNGDVGIVNTLTNTLLPTAITVGGSPYSSVALANGSRVYVGSAGSGVVSVIDTATNTVVATIATPGLFPAGLAASPDSRFVYVSDPLTNSVYVIDTSTNIITTTVAVGSLPTPIAVSNASGKIYVGNAGDNTISVIDPATYTVNTVGGLAAGPMSFGPCPCSTKIYVGLADNTTVQLFTANDTLDPTPLSAPGTSGMGITPNGATAWAVDPVSNITTINTLTNRTNTVSAASGGNPNGNTFVTFVGNVPTAYTNNISGGLDVFQMSTLSAPNINLNSDSADIEVATGSTTLNLSAANGAAQVNSAGNVILASGTASTALQVATTGDINVTGGVTASRLDFHALNGTFTNVVGNTITASNGDLFIASPNIVNNGQLFAQNGGADTAIALQGPRGVLNVTQGPAGVMTSLIGGGLGLITLNAAGGSSATITGGSLMPDDELQFFGNDGYTATMNVNNLGPTATPGPGSPDVAVFGRAGNVSLITAQGDLNICGCLTLNNVNGNGGNFNAAANGGALLFDGGVFTGGSGVGNKAGDITLFGNEGVFVFGPLSARGENGANGGNIVVTALQNGFQLIDFSDGITSGASSGNAGNITLTAPDFAILAPVVDASSIDGNAGAIRITSSDAFTPLQIDPAGCGCNTIAGNITANSSNGNAGVVQISAAGGTEVGSGVNISASSFNGNAGAVLFSGGTFNNGPVTLQNDGGIQAISFSNPNSGVIGFATGGAGVTVTGAGGLLQAGQFISVGTLNPNTGVPIPSFFLVPIPGSPFTFQNVSIDQGILAAPFLAVGFTPPIAAPTPLTPAVTPSVTTPSTVRPVSFATLGAFPNLLPNTTIISTDQESQDFPTGGKNPLYQGFLEMRHNPQQPLLYGLYIDSPLTQAMTEVGGTAAPGPDGNSIVLQSGNAFVTAIDRALDVVTNNGVIHVPVGAAVFIMETGSGTIAYNLHDENSGSVYITSEGTRIPVGLGAQVLVSNTDASFDSLNVGSLIAVRNVTKAKGPNGKTVYVAEFSLPSAIVSIDPVRKLFRSDSAAQRAWADKITRNAAILMTVANRGGAYTKTKNQ